MVMSADMQQELERALRENDGDAFRRLYERHPHYRDGEGRTLLHVAIEHGLFDVVEGDISSAIVDASDKNGRTPLMVAAERGYSLVCEELLGNGVSTSATTVDGSTALALALQHGHHLVCQVLVAADPEEGVNRLLQAIRSEAQDEVVLLVKAGVPLDIMRATGGVERNPLREAIGHPAILRELLRFGAPVNAKSRAGISALTFAAADGNLVACELLLENGASLTSKDNDGRTPMFHACSHERENVIARFVQLGATVDSANNKGRTALFYHAERGNALGCELLLRFHANANHKDMSEWTALHLAASYGHKEVCRLLLGHTSSTDTEQEGQSMILCQPTSSIGSWISVTETCLMRIYAKLVSSGVQATMQKYGTLRIRDCSMNTLLHVAASSASDKHCYYLIRCLHTLGNIAINTQNCFCETPLDVAADLQCSLASSALQSLGAVQISSESEIFPSVIQLAPPGRGALFHTVIGSSRDFTICSREELVHKCRAIQDGLQSCTDEIITQLDADQGDTVLHYFLQSFLQRASFPSVEEQRAVLDSSKWLGNADSSRLMRAAVNKANWEGKTPLHIAAEVGALGFCEVLIEKGASASEECLTPDTRLLDQPTEDLHAWKPLNFAATVKASLDDAQASFEERSALVEYLLRQPDALPVEKNAMHDCKEKIKLHFPLLLPLFLRVKDDTKHREDYAEAEELYDKFLDKCYPGLEEVRMYENDPSGVSVHNIFLNTARRGIKKTLRKVVAPQCIIETTGDTLLHLVAVHGHRDFAGLIKYLVDDAHLDINKTNKQMKTALHVACEHNMPDVCRFLISRGADVMASCQNLQSASKEVWHTPLYMALWSPRPKYEIIEILLSTPGSVVKPRNPKLHRTDRNGTAKKIPEAKWNSVLLDQLVKVHPSSIPLFLDHYAIEVNRINGERVYRFTEVYEVCQHLEQIVNPTGSMSPSLSKKILKNSAIMHPVVRNAIKLKWKLFGSRTHRKQLALYVLMVTFFYLSNLLLPKIEVTTLANGKSEESSHKWIAFSSPLDWFVGVTKICCWLLAIYHLVYVEFLKEWRAEPKRYWRSVWNLLDVFTYLLVLGTIPFEVQDGYDTLRECMLSLLSILLCVNLMQALMVSSYFSVLIFTFARMFQAVARFLFQYLLLLLGFSGSLFLLYHGTGPYADFFSAMRIVFLTTFGEINYGDSYSFDDSLHARNYLAFMILTLYVLVVIVVAMNLLIALMTSEYEKVRAQAKELSLLELAGALHRYEQWIGRNVVRQLYSSRKGKKLLEACVKSMPDAKHKRRYLYHGQLRSVSSSFSAGSLMQSGHYEDENPRRSKIGAMEVEVTGKTESSGLEVASVTEAIATQVMKRVREEMAALRVQVTTELQDVRELLETAQQENAQAEGEVVSKLSQVLELLAAQGESRSSSSFENVQHP